MSTSSSASDAWERLSSLYEMAHALPAAERADYVNEACAQGDPLRGDLLALLEAGEDAGEFLDLLSAHVVAPLMERAIADPAWRSSAGSVRDEVVLSPEIQRGSTVRHYVVGDELGTGGMGTVFRARDERLDRDVAIKVLRADAFQSEGARRRLMEEARAVSLLDDPNVCAIHAVEDTEDGGLCLVMQLCTEGTLRERLKAGVLPLAHILALAPQVASGLAAAHRRGIVHRDLKPANVGLAHGGIVKLLDFGVALRHDVTMPPSLGTAAAPPRTFAGTLAYMAPELLGHGDATPRSDVWSLGVLYFELLTGRRPFRGDNRDELRGAILRGELPPLVRPDGAPIPPRLAQLVGDMLALDPTQRPADGDAVFARIAGMTAHESEVLHGVRPHARPHAFRTAEPVRTPISPLIPRAAWRWLTGLATASVLAVGWLLSRSDARLPSRSRPLELVRTDNAPPPVAVLPFAVRGDSQQDYLKEGMVDLLSPAFDATGLLRGIDPQAVLSATRQDSGATTDSAAQGAIARRLGAERYVVGSVVSVGSELTIRATLRDADGHETGRAVVTVRKLDGLPAGVQALVQQLVGGELRAPGDTIGGLAASSTRSVVALRAFLDGERELRDARPRTAMALFARAVEADSAFALAWYRLARAARWGAVDSLNRVATQRAYALASQLPYRWQTIVRGYHALQLGSVLEATTTFRELASMYPSDMEALMLFGEALVHDNPYHGRSSLEAEPVFRRAMALDPRNREVVVFLMDLAARANAVGALDTLFTMYFDPSSAGEQPGVHQNYLALHARRVLPDGGAAAARALADPITAQTALRRAANDPRDLDAARSFAQAMTRATAPMEVRCEGWLALATLRASAGAWAAAEDAWREAALLGAHDTQRHRAMTLLSLPEASTRLAMRTVRDTLLQRVAATTQPNPSFVEVGGLSSDEEAVIDWYLVGLLSSRLDDSVSVVRAVAVLERGGANARLRFPLRRALEARLALARRDSAQAMRAFAESEVDVPVSLRRRYPVLEQHVDRFARAELLLARGKAVEAARWYGAVVDGMALWGAPYRSRVEQRLQEISALRADNRQAAAGGSKPY